jgi:hypothetical protein
MLPRAHGLLLLAYFTVSDKAFYAIEVCLPMTHPRPYLSKGKGGRGLLITSPLERVQFQRWCLG